MSSSSRPPSARPMNRRMTLGGAPTNAPPRGSNHAVPDGDAQVRKGRTHRPPRDRQSMIPSIGRSGVENRAPSPVARRRLEGTGPGDVPSADDDPVSVPPVASLPASTLMVPTAASRRRSMGGPAGNASNFRRQSMAPSQVLLKSDQRPLTDKDYQSDCIKKILRFLSARDYDHPVSFKTLTRPSGKDFANIITFMLREADADFQDGTLKFEDEVALNFKGMNFPYAISKTALVAAGSPHTWPSLLAALAWLSDHLDDNTLEEKEEEALNDMGQQHAPFQTIEELEEHSERAFFINLELAYPAFLNEDQDRIEQLEAEFQDMFERDDRFLEREVERVTDLNSTVLEEVNRLTEGSLDLPAFIEKKEHYMSESEQMHELQLRLDEERLAWSKKKTERKAELEETERELMKMNGHVAELKQLIATQRLSPSDLLRIENDMKGADEAMERVLIAKKKHRSALLKSESVLTTLFDQLDCLATEYNDKIYQLSLQSDVGAVFKYLQAKLNRCKQLSPDHCDLLGVDLSKKVIPNVAKYTAQFNEHIFRKKAEHQDALDNLNRCMVELNIANSKHDIMKGKHVKSMETARLEKEAQDAKLAVCQREVDRIENKVASLRDLVAIQEQIVLNHRQTLDIEALRKDQQKKYMANTTDVIAEINEACQLMAEHDKYFQQKVSNLGQYCEQKLTSISKLSIPKGILSDK